MVSLFGAGRVWVMWDLNVGRLEGALDEFRGSPCHTSVSHGLISAESEIFQSVDKAQIRR